MHARPCGVEQSNTFKEKVREHASARLQRHTCREQPPPPTNSVIVWFIFMYFILLSVSVLFHSVHAYS